MFPVICLPLSLAVGLLVKYAKAPSNLDDSLLDSLTGDVDHIKWKLLPATVATSLASLWSGAVLGPEGAIGNISSRLAALYCDLFRIPAEHRAKLVYGSVAVRLQRAAGEPHLRRRARHGGRPARGRAASRCCRPTSSAAASATASSYVLHNTGFVNFLHLPAVTSYRLVDVVVMVPLGAHRPGAGACSPASS